MTPIYAFVYPHYYLFFIDVERRDDGKSGWDIIKGLPSKTTSQWKRLAGADAVHYNIILLA